MPRVRAGRPGRLDGLFHRSRGTCPRQGVLLCNLFFGFALIDVRAVTDLFGMFVNCRQRSKLRGRRLAAFDGQDAHPRPP